MYSGLVPKEDKYTYYLGLVSQDDRKMERGEGG